MNYQTVAPPIKGRNPEILFSHGLDAGRVSISGGDLLNQIQHPKSIVFERIYRRQPEEGMFDAQVSPSRPFVFELGAYRVPPQMSLLIFDLRPDIYRFSGLDPGDYAPVAARRFGSVVGFDITIDNNHLGNLEYELDPVPIQRTSTQAFRNRNPDDPFQEQASLNIGFSNRFANAAGSGQSLQPQRPIRFGAPAPVPFTLIAKSDQVVQVTCSIFRPFPSPIAFFEYGISGVLVPAKELDIMLKAIQPPSEE